MKSTLSGMYSVALDIKPNLGTALEFIRLEGRDFKAAVATGMWSRSHPLGEAAESALPAVNRL